MGTGFREVGFGFDEPQAHVVKARLDDAGIWSDVRPADSSSLGAFAIGAFFACSVRVRESDYDRAVDLLRTGSVDWDTVDVGEGEDHTVAAIARMSDEEGGCKNAARSYVVARGGGGSWRGVRGQVGLRVL